MVYFIFCTFCLSASERTIIPIYIIYTPSHAALFDNWFLPSLQRIYQTDEIVLYKKMLPQECPTASFKQDGWTKTTRKKVDYIIEAIQSNWGEVFIYSDVDIQFFRPFYDIITELMHGKDMVIQKNNPRGELCTGFFACRANEKTLQLWTLARQRMEKHQTVSDQAALNYYLNKNNNPLDISWDYLPDTFFGGGTMTGTGWCPGMDLDLPQGCIIMHHANYTKGIKNKIKQLSYIYSKVVISKQYQDLFLKTTRSSST
jgi:hypothetical protein